MPEVVDRVAERGLAPFDVSEEEIPSGLLAPYFRGVLSGFGVSPSPRVVARGGDGQSKAGATLRKSLAPVPPEAGHRRLGRRKSIVLRSKRVPRLALSRLRSHRQLESGI